MYNFKLEDHFHLKFFSQNIFCDWPCNLVGPNTICPSHKRVLMKERKQVPGGISQQEVLASSCPNTATLSIPFMVNNGWQIEKFQHSLDRNAQLQQAAESESDETVDQQQQ